MTAWVQNTVNSLVGWIGSAASESLERKIVRPETLPPREKVLNSFQRVKENMEKKSYRGDQREDKKLKHIPASSGSL